MWNRTYIGNFTKEGLKRFYRLNAMSLDEVTIASFHIIAMADGENSAPDGWRAAAPRDEIRPQFDYRTKGGKDGKGAFLIIADDREGLDGYWVKTFSITGGRHYRFFALRRVENVAAPSIRSSTRDSAG